MCKVIGYKGYLFIDGFKDKKSIENGKELKPEHLTDALLNKPLDEGQLGFVCDMNKCTFNSEAIKLLKEVKKSGDDIGAVDVFKSDDGPVFAWMGGPLMLGTPEQLDGSSAYDYELLDAVKPVDDDIPEDITLFMTELEQSVKEKKKS